MLGEIRFRLIATDRCLRLRSRDIETVRRESFMKVVVVLAMHGVPPKDFPRHELIEFMQLHTQLEHGAISGPNAAALEKRCAELDDKIRSWTRTPENDPYQHASYLLVSHLRRFSGYEVVVGFNEFCGPGIGEAMDQAVALGAEKVVVVTPMMTAGGEHSEVDVPRLVQEARGRHPGISIVYAWPFEPAHVAEFLAKHMARFL